MQATSPYLNRPLRKLVDTWQIHVNYGQGWEHECTEMSLREAREQVKCYRENCNYPVRVVKRREPLAV